jgi:hypothetical protein
VDVAKRLENFVVDREIIFECIVLKQRASLWNGLNWHRIGPEVAYCLRISYTIISANASSDNIKN